MLDLSARRILAEEVVAFPVIYLRQSRRLAVCWPLKGGLLANGLKFTSKQTMNLSIRSNELP